MPIASLLLAVRIQSIQSSSTDVSPLSSWVLAHLHLLRVAGSLHRWVGMRALVGAAFLLYPYSHSYTALISDSGVLLLLAGMLC